MGRPHDPSEGPIDFDIDEDLDREQILQFVRAAAQIGAQAASSYREAPRTADPTTKQFVVGVGVVICATVIIAAFTLASQFSESQGALREWRKATEERITKLEQLADRYRVSPPP